MVKLCVFAFTELKEINDEAGGLGSLMSSETVSFPASSDGSVVEGALGTGESIPLYNFTALCLAGLNRCIGV